MQETGRGPVGYQFHLDQSVVEKEKIGIRKQGGDYPSMAATLEERKRRGFSRVEKKTIRSKWISQA